ncbi:primosomal replication protein [Vibrio splendidus]|uniref:primosomal replication protein n=1 Tax=Vibrio splendidus TaxID=29497 RepID=UPI0009783F81|nr:primosomal replication protein [Vibrio splendidus]OMO21490.1 preprotein translocase subunit SecA [Vibrio splendidus]PMG30785.1 preprotein translocase subunit SecA [Vibrio splendidus]PMH11308.1 preprotein translocase subunit SecA [Vibrio splendidus]PMI85473.1 preprotein translocase subunit SecA [Vibrio splendidus]PMJ97083.1 preprotein translocase subunit SecA [Vibrio splendidus]
MNQFSKLKSVIDTLVGHCSQVDKARGAYHQALFDRTLFKSRAFILLPYALEAQTTYHTVLREQATNQLTASRANYLTEKLTNQIAAIQRELANHDLRLDRKSKSEKSLNDLYNELAQHQDWQKRLIDLVRVRKLAFDSAPRHSKKKADEAWQLAKERLERCEDSMKNIERLINLENPKRNEH